MKKRYPKVRKMVPGPNLLRAFQLLDEMFKMQLGATIGQDDSRDSLDTNLSQICQIDETEHIDLDKYSVQWPTAKDVTKLLPDRGAELTSSDFPWK